LRNGWEKKQTFKRRTHLRLLTNKKHKGGVALGDQKHCFHPGTHPAGEKGGKKKPSQPGTLG